MTEEQVKSQTPQTKLELAQLKMQKVKDNVKDTNARKIALSNKIKELKEELSETESKFKKQQGALKSVQKMVKKIQSEGDMKLRKNTNEAMGMTLLMGLTTKQSDEPKKKRFGLF